MIYQINSLATNPYPGRGIILGRSIDGTKSVAIYFIMGRSENSRNRIFVPTEDGIQTQAYDPSRMTNPDLIIYHPVRLIDKYLIVTNGDQTDTIRDALCTGKTFTDALKTRTFEPDPPHYTPRISALLAPDGSCQLAILKTADGDPAHGCQFFFHYDTLAPGEGRFIHTYSGQSGERLLPFEGEPIRIKLEDSDAETCATHIWENLNADNKISLFVRYMDSSGYQDAIRNKYHA